MVNIPEIDIDIANHITDKDIQQKIGESGKLKCRFENVTLRVGV